MKKPDVPEYMRSTYDLVTSAFPNGIDDDLYHPLLRFLEEHLSHRNLTDLVGLVTGREYHLAYDDVAESVGSSLSEEERAAVTKRLQPHGLDNWLAESWRAIPQRI